MGRPNEELSFDGVLLSHAHADHASYINHLREDLPIFCSHESYSILKAMSAEQKLLTVGALSFQ
jgi:ribonuclease J